MSARHRLLVIDYEPRSLKRTLASLEGTGFAVSGAGNAREISSELERAVPDAVIVEPMIPGQDGFKLIQSIKRLRPERPTFVIAASRIYRGPRFRGMAKEAGADLFVERPAQEGQILAALVGALGEQPEPTAPQPQEEMSAADMSVAEPSAAHPPASPPVTASPAATAPPPVTASRAAAAPPPPPVLPETPDSPVSHPPIPRPAAASLPSAASPAEQPVLAAASAGGRVTGARPRLSQAIPRIQSSDDEIDAALDRLLGPFGAPPPPAPPLVVPGPSAAPAPPLAAPPPAAPAPAARNATDPLGLSLDEGFRTRKPQARTVAGPLVNFDLEDVVGADCPRPVVIPTKADPAPAIPPPPASIPEDGLGFDPMTGDSGNISAPPAPEDVRDSRYMDFLLQEDPGTGPPPLDPSAPQRTGPLALPPESPRPSDDDDDIDRVLARVFAPGVTSQGAIPGIDAELPPSSPDAAGTAGEPAVPGAVSAPTLSAPTRSVPAGLRGMDAGTADLLSSLEELENSLPDGGPPSSDLRADSTWTPTTGFGDLTGQALQEIETSVPYTPPPPPEDEQTLQEVLAKISMEAHPTAEEVEPSLTSPPVQFDAFRQTGTQYGLRGRTGSAAAVRGSAPAAGDRPARPDVPYSVAVSSRALLTGALVAVVLLALAVGGWFFFVRETGTAADPPAAPSTTSPGNPMRFPAAPAPVPGKKKPKLKRPAAAPEAGVTRSVPGREKKPPANRESAPATPPATEKAPPVAALPQRARPEPAPAALRAVPRESPSPGQRPVMAADEPMSAADKTMSAADISAKPPGTPAAPAAESAAAGAGSANAADAAGAPIVRANELDAPVRATSRTVPLPTAEAVAARQGGRAFLNVLVGADGSVAEVRLMIDPGHGLGEAARRAAQAWQYTPPRRGGQAVRVWKTEVVEFERPADEADDDAESP